MPACKATSAWLTLLCVFAIGLVLDLGAKSWAFAHVASEPVELSYDDIAGNPSYRLPFHTGLQVLPWDLLDLRLVLNHGAVFGLGQQKRLVFIAFTIIAVAAALWIFGWWTDAKNRVAHVGIGLDMIRLGRKKKNCSRAKRKRECAEWQKSTTAKKDR